MMKSELETPSLLIDYDKMLKNIIAMQNVADESEIALRPHIKTHKCPQIAKLQQTRGALGVCTQTLGESEVMIASGLKNVFLTNHVVGKSKIDRLIKLEMAGSVQVAVDSLTNVRKIGAVSQTCSQTVPVLLEVNVGMGSYWCGVPVGRNVVNLAREISRVKGVLLIGVMTYEGVLPYRVTDQRRRTKVVQKLIAKLVRCAEEIRKNGQEIEVVSCGSTSTAKAAASVPGVTEIQPGNYVFYDLDQVKMGSANLENCALTVQSTVISMPGTNTVVVDAGIKAFCHDQGMFPRIVNSPGLTPIEIYEEQLVLRSTARARKLQIGDKLEFIPFHACTASNMHDQFNVARGDEVVATWPIAARGKMS